ncbi:hypothetical protein [Inquilinus sp. Marseille-Q2685]|uniref:hypothetical protein n=1 Tax=Inquilinus sp. Marseille-Q2685 TaxID=2866581 RepID=UPI001CE4314D|nr:hypothetical protein [Inquilinus sp. Marseille-Q2685]
MIRSAPTRARLSALCAALLLLPAATAGAQQALVPARPAAQPDWFESNRTLQVLRAQQQQGLRPAGQGGLAAGEAEQIYHNYMQQIGKPLPSGTGRSYGGSDLGFGSGMNESSGGRP